MRNGLIAAAGALALGACAHAGPPSPELAWRLEGLANPESVVAGAEAGVLFVSNVAGEGEAKDGVGFISRVSVAGEMLEREWVSGLNAPKGLARSGGTLFVTDIDEIVEIDIATRAVRRHAAPDAAFLNDAAVLRDATVLAADSDRARIYALGEAGPVEVWLEHDLLRAINGLAPEPDRLLVTTMEGRLLAVDYDTRAVSVLAEGLGDADGVARLSDGNYLVSEWRGRLFHVREGAAPAVILDTREEGVLLNDFLLLYDNLLVVPNWSPGTLSAYALARRR